VHCIPARSLPALRPMFYKGITSRDALPNITSDLDATDCGSAKERICHRLNSIFHSQAQSRTPQGLPTLSTVSDFLTGTRQEKESSTSREGKYNLMVSEKIPSGAGSQLDSLSTPGDSC